MTAKCPRHRPVSAGRAQRTGPGRAKSFVSGEQCHAVTARPFAEGLHQHRGLQRGVGRRDHVQMRVAGSALAVLTGGL